MDHLQQLVRPRGNVCACSRAGRPSHLDIRAHNHVCARGCLRCFASRAGECLPHCWWAVPLGVDFGTSTLESRAGRYHARVRLTLETDNSQSYCCGAINVFTWIALGAGIAIILPQLCLGMSIFWNPDYVPQAWHAFLIYQASNFLVLLYNIYLLRRTMWLHDLACKSDTIILLQL